MKKILGDKFYRKHSRDLLGTRVQHLSEKHTFFA